MGVLVAISIPIFTSQLEKAREAVDLANIRAAYAECTTSVLNDDHNSYYKKVDIKQTADGWVSTPDKIAGTVDVTTDITGSKLGKTYTSVYVCVAKDGTFTLSHEKPTGSDVKEVA